MRFYQIIFILFIGCSKVDPNQAIIPKNMTELSNEKADSTEKNVLRLNKEIMTLLKNKEYDAISAYLSTEKGLQFSMYSYVSGGDKVFTKMEFDKYVNSDIRFTFGEKDGLAEKYTVSLKDYFRGWVFKKDFSKAKVNFEAFEGRGNTKNNIKEKYPSSIVVENYIKGTAEYSYMDWNSLILVFDKLDDQYVLVGIVNNQWTT